MHVTRDSDTLSRSKGQRSRSPGRFGWLYWQANVDIQ